MKKFFRIFLKVLAGLLLVILAAFAALQSPKVQTWAGKKAVDMLREKTDADIDFNMVSLRPFEAVTLDDVSIIDRNPQVDGADTIAFIGSLNVKFTPWGLLTGDGAYVSSLRLDDATVQLVTEADSLSPTGSRMNLLRIFRLPYSEQKDELPTWGNILNARSLVLRNVRVRMSNPVLLESMEAQGAQKGGKINFADIDATVNYLGARNIKVADSKVVLALDTLSAYEKSGFVLHGASAGKVNVAMDRIRLDNLHLKDDFSDIRLKTLQLDGSIKDYSDFVEKILITGDIRTESLVSMKTVAFFGPLEESMDFRGTVKGKVKGYVNDLKLTDMDAKDQDHNFSARVNGRIMNVTDIQNSSLDINLQEAKFTLKGLEGFLRSWAPDLSLDLDNFGKGELFSFAGTAKGPLNRLGVNGTLSSRLGIAKADITVRNTVDEKRPIIIDGGLRTRDLNVGKIAGIDAIGPVTLGTSLSASLPKGGDGISVRIDSLKIDRLNALGYDYTNLSAVGNYAEDAFDGRIIAADPNLNFLFQGKFNLSKKTKNKVYRFYASLGYADLHALKIDKRPNSKISFQAYSNFLMTESHDILGDVNVSGLTLESATGTHHLGDLTAKAHSNDDVSRINISSSFLEGSYYGDKGPFDFINHLRSLTLDRELNALSTEPAPEWDGSTYSLDLKVKDAHDFLDFFAPGAYAANPTEVKLGIDENGTIRGSINSDRLALGEKYIRNLDLDLTNDKNVLRADLTSSAIQIASGVKLLGSRLSLFANDNHLGVGYSFDNTEEGESKAELYLSADLDRDEEGLAVVARALPSNLYYRGSGWGISSGDILFKGGDISVDALRARHDTELLEVDGGFSSRKADTLKVSMEKFDVGIVSNFIGNILPIEGYASGNAVIISPGNPIPGVEAAIVCDSTRVSGQRIGTLSLASNWDEPAKRFNLDARTLLDGKNTLNIGGYFVPEGQTLSAEALLNGLDLACISPILSTVFSTFDGKLGGAVTVNGPVSKLKIGSRDLKLSDGHIALDFTRALYDVEGDLALTRDALSLTELRLKDNAGGKATVKGDILLNGFQDLGTDLRINMEKLKALDLKRGENPTLYGSLPVSGNLTVKGPLSRIVVNIDAATSGPGDLHLPIGGASGEVQRKMLVFTEPPDKLQQDPYELMMASNAKQASSSSNLIINLSAHATPDATVYIDLGENTLNARGSGNIGLNIETAQNSFGLSGDYTLQEGSFRFSAMNLVSRDFTIQDGSSVRFNGPVNETDLNVKGLYTTKASLDNLMTVTETESSSGSSRRTVNCGIDITGKLRNPELRFSIDVPDLNPSTKIAIDNALSTEDKVQKQFVYLLIASSFLPDEDSGVTTTGSEMLYSNVSSIMSGQINNIFEKLNIPLDLGLNYKAQDGRNLFDVAVSTQLFNNRVIVNGAVGNKQLVGSTTSEITGDIDVEIKLGKSGNLRTTLFSHSADQFSSYLDNSQRNGVGMTYQKEFYSISQLFNEMFLTRQEREERARRQLLNTAIPQSYMQIDSTGKPKPIEEKNE